MTLPRPHGSAASGLLPGSTHSGLSSRINGTPPVSPRKREGGALSLPGTVRQRDSEDGLQRSLTSSHGLLEEKEDPSRLRRMWLASRPAGGAPGEISEQSLARVLRSELPGITSAQVEQLLHQMDPEGTGSVSFAVFQKVMQARDVILHGEDGFHEEPMHTARRRIMAAQRGPGAAVRPDTITRSAMDVAVLAAATYHGASVILYLIGRLDSGGSHRTISYAASLVQVGGVIANFFTAFLQHHNVVFDLREISHHYLKTWFVVDLLSALPFDFIAQDAGLGSQAFTALHCLRVLSLARIPALFRLSSPDTMGPAYINWFFRIVPLIRRFVYCGLAIHWTSCIWVVINEEWGSSSGRYDYIEALYWVIYTITTVGYGDIPVTTNEARMFACLLIVVGFFVQAILVGQLTVTVMQGDLQGDRNARMYQTMAVLEHFAVPNLIQEEILGYQYHALHRNLGASYAELITMLPQSMQDQVGLFMRMRFISQVPMFGTSETQVQVALAQSLRNLVLPPDTPVVIAGERGEEMFFICYGFCDVVLPPTESNESGVRVATISKGGFFGENGLISAAARTATVVTLTFVDLFVLQKHEFDDIASHMPSLAETIMHEVDKRDQRQGLRSQQQLSPTAGAYRVRPDHSSRVSDDAQTTGGLDFHDDDNEVPTLATSAGRDSVKNSGGEASPSTLTLRPATTISGIASADSTPLSPAVPHSALRRSSLRSSYSSLRAKGRSPGSPTAADRRAKSVAQWQEAVRRVTWAGRDPGSLSRQDSTVSLSRQSLGARRDSMISRGDGDDDRAFGNFGRWSPPMRAKDAELHVVLAARAHSSMPSLLQPRNSVGSGQRASDEWEMPGTVSGRHRYRGSVISAVSASPGRDVPLQPGSLPNLMPPVSLCHDHGAAIEASLEKRNEEVRADVTRLVQRIETMERVMSERLTKVEEQQRTLVKEVVDGVAKQLEHLSLQQQRGSIYGGEGRNSSLRGFPNSPRTQHASFTHLTLELDRDDEDANAAPSGFGGTGSGRRMRPRRPTLVDSGGDKEMSSPTGEPDVQALRQRRQSGGELLRSAAATLRETGGDMHGASPHNATSTFDRQRLREVGRIASILDSSSAKSPSGRRERGSSRNRTQQSQGNITSPELTAAQPTQGNAS